MIISIYTLRENDYDLKENGLAYAKTKINFNNPSDIRKYYKNVYSYKTDEFDKFANQEHLLIGYIIKKFNTQSDWPDDYNYGYIKISDLLQIDDKLYYVDTTGFVLVDEGCEVVNSNEI